MSFELPPLPYPQDALEPHISAETLSYHYGKHHAGYVDKLNAALQDSELRDKSLLEIVRGASGGLFNNAAQVWNHSFYWQCLSPQGGGEPAGTLGAAIDKSFGSLGEFKKAFADAAAGNFGSGWTWLVARPDGALEIMNTDDAETPASDEQLRPLLTLDVWEHAYYIDYRNARADYIEAFWSLVNWEFAAACLAGE